MPARKRVDVAPALDPDRDGPPTADRPPLDQVADAPPARAKRKASEQVTCEICGQQMSLRGLGQHRFHAHGISADKATPKMPSTKRGSKQLAEQVEAMLSMVGLGVGMVDIYDGEVIARGAPALATALVNTSERNPTLRKLLERAVESWTYSELFAASAMIAVPILAHHGLAPARVTVLMSNLATSAPDDASGAGAPGMFD